MKFYDCQTAPSPRRVRMFIAEKGLDIPSVEVNLREREHLQAPFLAINPFATVPVLALDDGTILRSTAGCRAYLESAFPSPPLLGGDAVGKGVVADLVWRIEADAIAPVAECLRNTARGMKDRALTGVENYEQLPQLAERGRQRAERFFPVLERLLGERPCLAGERISAADIDAFVFVEFARWVKIEVPGECTGVRRWHEAMSARPSAGR